MDKRRSEADRRARQSQRVGRALRLLCLIQERHGRWDLPSLARELSCSTKTVQRDLLALEEARIPFFYDKQKCCYAIRPGFRLSILDDQWNSPSEPEADSSSREVGGSPSTMELAQSSKDHAERLRSESERLLEDLGQLCRSLARLGRGPGKNGPRTE